MHVGLPGVPLEEENHKEEAPALASFFFPLTDGNRKNNSGLRGLL
jgi:hypothetical protein